MRIINPMSNAIIVLLPLIFLVYAPRCHAEQIQYAESGFYIDNQGNLFSFSGYFDYDASTNLFGIANFRVAIYDTVASFGIPLYQNQTGNPLINPNPDHLYGLNDPILREVFQFDNQQPFGYGLDLQWDLGADGILTIPPSLRSNSASYHSGLNDILFSNIDFKYIGNPIDIPIASTSMLLTAGFISWLVTRRKDFLNLAAIQAITKQ
jgi:hypothetical protein